MKIKNNPDIAGLKMLLLGFLVGCSDATGANVFGGLFAVDFHFYFLQIGAVGFGCLSVRVRNLVA